MPYIHTEQSNMPCSTHRRRIGQQTTDLHLQTRTTNQNKSTSRLSLRRQPNGTGSAQRAASAMGSLSCLLRAAAAASLLSPLSFALGHQANLEIVELCHVLTQHFAFHIEPNDDYHPTLASSIVAAPAREHAPVDAKTSEEQPVHNGPVLTVQSGRQARMCSCDSSPIPWIGRGSRPAKPAAPTGRPCGSCA